MLALFTMLLFCGGIVFAQSRTISGTVTGSQGEPLSGVSVLVKGTQTGTTSGNNGFYSLSIPQDAKELQFSSLGFEARTVRITSSNTINVTLEVTAATGLEEVVITGIGRVKKSQFTGAVNKIDTKELSDKPVGSFDQLFQGRAPGVLALTGSGQPGQNSTIIIRGTNSVVGGSTPLYIVDGIQVEASVFQGYNPNDFASIEIARDAATTALYGSRGSAGVIIVTTKRGTGGKMRLTYDGQMGIKSKPDFAFRPMNTRELLQTQEDYGKIAGGGSAIPGWYYSPANPRVQGLSPAGQENASRLLDSISKIDVNWHDEIFRPGSFSNHQISLSGGTGKTRIYSSLALYNEEGTTTRTDMQRVTFRNNMDYSDDKFTASLSTSFGYTKRNFQQSTTGNNLGNPFLAGNIQVPYARVYNEDGSYATGTGSRFAGANQLDATKYDQNYNDQMKATIGVNLSYKITPDITASLTSGVDFRETQNTNYGSKLAYNRLSSTSITGKAGFQQESLSRFATSSVRPSITFQKLIGEKSDIDVTVLGEYVQENYKSFNLTGYGIDPRTPNTPAVITQGNADNQLYSSVGGGKGRTGLASGLAMARYTYDGKYTVTGSYRQDGSSKLPVANRWRDFFSVGAIWDIAKEDFMQSVNFVNILRLRGSYGSAGNSNNFPGDYLYQATYSSSGNYAGLTTQTATYPGNPDAKWEVTYQTNVGLDFELANRRIYGDVNWYDKRTKDLFIRRSLPAEAGSFAINVNAGELQNTGFEWNINGEVVRTRDFVWTLFANGAYNKNELLSLGGEEPYESGTSYLKIGYPLGTHYEIKWGGVDAATGMPLYYDADGNLTTNYSASYNVLDFGTWEAPWKGGFGTTLRYKSFDVNVLFSWQQGGNKLDNLEYFVENPIGFMSGGYNQSSDLNFWKKPGDIASTPSPLYGTNFSSKFIHDASFMRLKDVTIGYNLPSGVTEKLKFISNARFFVQGTNLFIWTTWRGMDPEAGAANLNLSEFPNSRAFTGGLKVTF